MAKDVDFRYNEMYAELEMYLRCVENLIKKYEESSDVKNKPISHLQVSKLKPLVKLVRTSNKRMSLENLNKCKNVFQRIYNRTNKPELESNTTANNSNEDFEAVRAKLNFLVSKSKKQTEDIPTPQTQYLFPSVINIAADQSSSSALNAYMNSHIALNHKYISNKGNEPQSKLTSKDSPKSDKKDVQQSSPSLYHRRDYKCDKPTRSTSKEKHSPKSKDSSIKQDQKNDSHKDNTQFKERDKKCKKSGHKTESRVPINEETDIDTLEEIRSEIVKKLELDKTFSRTSKINDHNVKIKINSEKSTGDQDYCDKNTTKLNNTGIISNKIPFKATPVNKLQNESNKDTIIDEEIENELKKEISGLDISLLSSSSTVLKKEAVSNLSTKTVEKSTSRRISLDTYKEKHSTTTDRNTQNEENVATTRLLLCPASPDPENCQIDNSVIITKAIPTEDNFKLLDSIQTPPLKWSNNSQKPVNEFKREWNPLNVTEDNFKLLDSIQAPPLEWSNNSQKPINEFKREWNPLNVNPISPQNFMNVVGSPLYRMNTNDNTPICSDTDMRQFPVQPMLPNSGFSLAFEPNRTGNFIDNSLIGAASPSILGSPNNLQFNTNYRNNFEDNSMKNIPRNIYKPITREPILTIESPNSSFDSNFRNFDDPNQFQRGRVDEEKSIGRNMNSNQFQRGPSIHRNEFVRGRSQTRDDYSRGRSMGRNEREKSIGKDINAYNVRRNDRERSVGRNLTEYNMGISGREKSMGRDITEHTFRRNDRERSIGRNMNEYNNQFQRGPSMHRNEFVRGRSQTRDDYSRGRSMGRNEREKSIGRDDRGKSMGRNIQENNTRRNIINENNIEMNERERNVRSNISDSRMSRSRDPRIARNRDRSMGRFNNSTDTREKNCGRFNTDIIGQYNRDRSVVKYNKEHIDTNNDRPIGQFQSYLGNNADKFHWQKTLDRNSSNENISKALVVEKSTTITQKSLDDSRKSILNYKIPRIKKENIPSPKHEEIDWNDESVTAPTNLGTNQVETSMEENKTITEEIIKDDDSNTVSASNEQGEDEDLTPSQIISSKQGEDEVLIPSQTSEQTYASSLTHSIEEADSTNKLNEYEVDTSKLDNESLAVPQMSNEPPTNIEGRSDEITSNEITSNEVTTNETSGTNSNKDEGREIFDDKTFYTLMETLRQKKNAIPEKYIKIIEMYNDLRSKEEQGSESVEENLQSKNEPSSESVEENFQSKDEPSSESVEENLQLKDEQGSESVGEKVPKSTTNELIITSEIITHDDQNIQNKINEKRHEKGNRELRMLQQDLRDMFISRDVLEANGKRIVKPIPEYKEPEKVERPKRTSKGSTVEVNTKHDNVSASKNESESSDISNDSSPTTKTTRRSLRNKSAIEEIKHVNEGKKSTSEEIKLVHEEKPAIVIEEIVSPITKEPKLKKKIKPKRKAPLSPKKKVKKYPKKIKKKILMKCKNKESIPVTEKTNSKDVPESQLDSSKNCLQCKTSKIRDVVYHFKTRHPREDIPTSKLNDKIATHAIELAKSGFVHTSGSSSQKCAFCEKLFDIEFPKSLLHHIAYCHTGEYEINCNNCVHLSNGRCTYDCIDNKLLGKSNTAKKILDIKGNICEFCNYVQISKDAMADHINETHPNQECNIFEISLILNTNISIPKISNTPIDQPVNIQSSVEPQTVELTNKIITEEPEPIQLDRLVAPIDSCLDGIFSSSRNINSPNFDSTYDIDTINNIKQENVDLMMDYDQQEIQELADSLALFESNDDYFDNLSANNIKVSHIKIEICPKTGKTKYSCPVEDCNYSDTILSDYEGHLTSHHDGGNFVWDGYCDICNSEVNNDYSSSNIPIINAFEHAKLFHTSAHLRRNMQLDPIRTDTTKENKTGFSPIRISNVFSLASSTEMISEPSTSLEISDPIPDVHKCPFCDLTYNEEDMILKHFVNEHVESGTYEHFFKCAIDSCKTECHQSIAFSDHLKNDHPYSTNWKCIYCDIVIPKHNKLLIVHMQKEHFFEAFKCKMCDFRSNEPRNLMNHVIYTHGSKFKYSFLRIPYNALPENISKTTDDLYLCSKCEFSSNCEKIFNDHLMENDDCLTCIDCKNRKFRLCVSMLSHYKKVHTYRNISCNYCNFRTVSLKQAKRHGTKKHNVTNDVSWRIIPCHPSLEDNNKYFSCCSCYFTSHLPGELLDHFKLHEKNDINLLNCKHCKVEFANPEALVEHIYAMHFPWANLSKMYDFDMSGLPKNDEQPPVQAYSCVESGKKFISKEVFVNHFVLSCPLQYKCQICDFEPDNWILLLDHLSSIHNFRKYNCSVCDFATDELNLVSVHMKLVHNARTSLVYMRYNIKDCPTGVLLLLNTNIVGKPHIFYQVTTDFQKVVNIRNKLAQTQYITKTEPLDENMAISIESNVTNTFQQGNNDQSNIEIIKIMENSFDAKKNDDEEHNSDSDNDALYIDDGNPPIPEKPTNDNLDFKTTILKRNSIDSKIVIEPKPVYKPGPKSSRPQFSKDPITNLKRQDLFKCSGTGCGYSCSTFKKFQGHTYGCAFVKDNLSCYHCGELFHKVSMLLYHVMTHGIAKYICDVCKISEPCARFVNLHMKKAHNISNTTITPLDPKKRNPDTDTFIARSSDAPVVEAAPVVVDLSFGPTDIDSIPNRPIFSIPVKCKICSYENKVRTNIIRHLQMHLNEDESCIPTAAPVNPVPHLETNEMYFDKMTNLALSSNIDKLQEKSPSKNEIDIFKSSVSSNDTYDLYPKFVVENKRFVCGSMACIYTSISEEMLRRHWESLHNDEESFRCQHCDLYLTKQENSSMISTISQHFHLHKEKLYKCSSCDFLADEIHYVKNHSFKAHNHKIFITIRDNLVDNNQPVHWRCVFCSVKTALKKEIMEHVQIVHNYRDQYKCGYCNVFRPTRNTMLSHFKKFHTDLPLNMTSSFHNMNETLETTPEKKKRTSSVTKTETPESTPEKRKRTSSTNKIENKSKKPKISNETNIENIFIDPNWTFGHPENENYKCSICTKFSSADAEEFENHLREELKYHRYGCCGCKYTSYSENAVINHSLEHHEMCEVKLLSKNTKVEKWIADYLTHQKLLMFKCKIEPQDSSSEFSILENDEKDAIDPENILNPYSEKKVEDAYDFVDDSPSAKVKKCPYCDGFVGKNLRVHIMRHKGIKPYKCHYCDYDAVTIIEVRLHQRRSHISQPIKVVTKDDKSSSEIDVPTPKPLNYVRKNMKQYVCTVCKLEISLKNVSDHKLICHPNSTTQLILFKSSDVLACSICSAYAVTEPLMKDHFDSSHPGAELKFSCVKLGKKSTKLFRRFSCKFCLTNFKEYRELLEHFESKHREIPIQILAYTTSNVKTTGETTVKGGLRCIITGCDYVLKNPLDLLFHVRCHYESYYCDSCSLLFISHSKYLNHPCPKGNTKLKYEGGGAILKQRLPQIYQILSRTYGESFQSVTCEDYLKNVELPDVTDVIEIGNSGDVDIFDSIDFELSNSGDTEISNSNIVESDEPLPKKLKQVAKKSTTQVNPQHMKFI